MTEYDRLVRDFAWHIPHRYNLGEATSDRQAALGHDTAIVALDHDWGETRYSFRYLSECSNKLANLLVSAGFARGDRIAVILPPSIEAAVAHIGILKAGMVSVPILPDYKSQSSTDRLALSSAAALFTSCDHAEANAEAWSTLPGLRQVYAIADGDGSSPSHRLERMLSSCRSHFRIAATTSRDPALLGFTSGSEGQPKGVLHAHSIVMGGLPSLLFSETPRAGHVAWSHFEWGWLGGLLVALGAWHCGTAILLHHQATLTPGRTIELLRRAQVNHVSIAPTALKMLRTGTRSAAYPQLFSITSGGEKLDVDTREWVQSRFGIPLSEIYGLSECGAVLGSGHILPIREGAIGKPAPGQRVHIVSETGKKLRNNEPGFIAVQSPHPSMFLGYWQDPEATKKKFLGSLYNTGDLGYRDEEGYFWYLSRGDDLISSAGHRVGPAEIEDVFSGFPGIDLCAVVGVPNALSGEAIVLWVQLSQGQAPSQETEEAIHAHARKTLASYQLPQRVRFVEAIPLTATGKVHRRAVRDQELAMAN